MRESPFREFIPLAAGDAGGAIGVAAYIYHFCRWVTRAAARMRYFRTFLPVWRNRIIPEEQGVRFVVLDAKSC